MDLISTLPPELAGLILSYLDGKATITVCNILDNARWKEEASRQLRKLCKKNISSDIISEMRDEMDCTDENDYKFWESVYTMFSQAEIDASIDDEVIHLICCEPNHRKCNSVLVHDGWLYSVDTDGVIMASSLDVMYRDKHVSKESNTNYGFEGSYSVKLDCSMDGVSNSQISAMHKHKIMVVSVAMELKILPLINSETKNEWCELKPDVPFQKSQCRGSQYPGHSVYSNMIAVSPTDNTLEVYIVTSTNVKSNTISIIKCGHFATRENHHVFQLYKHMLISIQTTGHVLVWNIYTQELKSKSGCFMEIRYENPCFLLHNKIITFTSLSSQLLNYWHMDRGETYWLMGSVNDLYTITLFRCRLGDFHPTEPGANNIKCISMRRHLCVCGTNDGRVLLFRMDAQLFTKETCTLTFRTPVIDHQIAKPGSCIVNVEIGFSNENIIIVARLATSDISTIVMALFPTQNCQF